MDDGVVGSGWSIDPDTRIQLRLERVRALIRDLAWSDAVLEAEELLDEHPDHPEGLFLLGEALLELGDWELAHAVYQHRVSLDGGDVGSLVGLAVASFHLCDLPATTELAREAVRRDPGNAEGHYYLGLALERTGRTSDAATELAAAAQLDSARFPLPVSLKRKDWEGLIAQAVDELPPRLQAFYARVPFRIEELPSLEELRSHQPPLSPTVGALYTGDPPSEDDPFDSPPEAIRVFTRNLARAGTVEGAAVELRNALQDEALDWLGEDHDEGLEEAP
jgi:tetratricopeptide (TPR) repeat protein